VRCTIHTSVEFVCPVCHIAGRQSKSAGHKRIGEQIRNSVKRSACYFKLLLASFCKCVCSCPTSIGNVFMGLATSHGPFIQLSRHETTIGCSYHRALYDLERLQARRKGEAVIPPVVFTSQATTERSSRPQSWQLVQRCSGIATRQTGYRRGVFGLPGRWRQPSLEAAHGGDPRRTPTYRRRAGRYPERCQPTRREAERRDGRMNPPERSR
jgi:hypothetical protein